MEGDTKMTEDQIERRVESMTGAVDREYLSSNMAEAGYRHRLKQIDDWASLKYYELRLARKSD
jgi:hypothetical protein